MYLDYTTTREIVKQYYKEVFSYWRTAGMNPYQAWNKADQEVAELTRNPYNKAQRLDHKGVLAALEDMAA